MANGDIWLAGMDVFDFIGELEDGSVDGVITDLPYPTTERHRNRGTTTRTKASAASSNAWYSVMTITGLVRFFEALWPKLAKEAAVFAYLDTWTWILLAHEMGMIEDLKKLTEPGVSTSRAPKDGIGYQWRQPLTWGKTTLDSGPIHAFLDGLGHKDLLPAKYNEHKAVKLRGGTGHHGQMCTELILYLEKGKFQLQHNFLNLALEPRPQPKPDGATLKAASPKPAKTAERLARAMAPAGSLLIDPFVGCGEHAIGISNAGMTALVNDVVPDLARDRIQNAYGRVVNDWPGE